MEKKLLLHLDKLQYQFIFKFQFEKSYLVSFIINTLVVLGITHKSLNVFKISFLSNTKELQTNSDKY